nr:hypothetical protein [Salinisphaera sp.]
DVIAATEVWQERGDQFSHRLFVRTVFASAEGIIQVMKAAALLFDELNDPSVLTSAEILLLKEQEAQIRNNGKIELARWWVSSMRSDAQRKRIGRARPRPDPVLNKPGVWAR